MCIQISYSKSADDHDTAISSGKIYVIKAHNYNIYSDDKIEAEYFAKTKGCKVEIDMKEKEVCSKCGRIRAADGIWEFYEDTVTIKSNIKDDFVGNVSHSICPECMSANLDDLYEDVL